MYTCNLLPRHHHYRRNGLLGTHRYITHTAYQVHTVVLTKTVQTLDKKRTAPIKRKLEVGEAKYLQVKQAHEGSANEDHFTKN